MLQIFIHTTLDYLREFAEITVLGFFVAGVLNAIVDKTAVARHVLTGILGYLLNKLV